MIDYGYFRHRFDASNDPKLQGLVDDMGIVALGYYFSLLEIYGANFNKRDKKGRVEIHRRVIANSWRKRVDSCDKVLTKLALSGLLVVTKLPLSDQLVTTKSKNTYIIEIPNFLKYYGSYKKIEKINTTIKENKRKVNKRKENKSIVGQIVISEFTHEVINYLNLKANKKYKASIKNHSLINARQNEKHTIEEFKHVIDVKIADWSGGEYEKFIRPETLFGNKFENYVNQGYENNQSKNMKQLKETYKANPYE